MRVIFLMNALSTQLKLAFCYIRSCNVCQSNSTKYEGKHSSRTDSVSMHIIKAVDLGILIRLTLLVNLTMVMSVYLAGEIVRRVIPLFQEGSITCKGNYKSISKLGVFLEIVYVADFTWKLIWLKRYVSCGELNRHSINMRTILRSNLD